MGRHPIYDYELLAGSLFDELVLAPEGRTLKDISSLLDVPSDVSRKVIKTLRFDLGDGDAAQAITVPVVREGSKHIYKLSGTLAENHDWILRRGRTRLENLKTDVVAIKPIVRREDGRMRAGRAARLLETSLTRLLEDAEMFLEEMDVELV